MSIHDPEFLWQVEMNVEPGFVNGFALVAHRTLRVVREFQSGAPPCRLA
nr:hypothetical protein [uncultured Aquabacterium sp.]